jgi:succinate dehydrogenase / fumarate reductase cytochrome b subunit
MAISGAAMFGFVVLHLAGNLQIFEGPEKFNGYARAVHDLGALLWVARAGLLIMAVLHIWSTIQLAVVRSHARPVSYARYQPSTSTYASRSMYMTGPIVAAFIVYHLLHFTFGLGGTSYNPDDAYGNVIAGFRVPVIAISYIVAMALLCLHLRHGLWSALQTLGLNHPRYTPHLRVLATLIALAIFFGFISIPIAVLSRVVPQYL